MRFILLSTLLLASIVSFGQDTTESMTIEPIIKSPFEHLYEEKLSISLHKRNNEKVLHETIDYVRFGAHGDYECHFNGITGRGDWSYNPEDKSIQILFAEGEENYIIKSVEKTKINFFSGYQIFRLFIADEDDKNIPILAKPNRTKPEGIAAKEPKDGKPKVIDSPLKKLYGKKLSYSLMHDVGFDIYGNKKDYVIFSEDGVYSELFLTVGQTGHWVYYPKTNKIAIIKGETELFDIEITKTHLILTSGEKTISLSIE